MNNEPSNYSVIAQKLYPDKNELYRIKNAAQKAVALVSENIRTMVGYSSIKTIGSIASGYMLRGTRDIDIVIHFKTFDKYDFRSRINKIAEFSEIQFSDTNRIVFDKFNCKFQTMDLSCGVVIGELIPETSLQADIFHHPDFWHKNNPPPLDDVLLCKQFFKILKLYGTHIGGFAVELLVAHFGTFKKTIQALSTLPSVKVDFSGRYNFRDEFLVISYPFSGLDNLVKSIGAEEEHNIRDYAINVLANPYQFQIDSQLILSSCFWERRLYKYGSEEMFGIPDIYLSRLEERYIKRYISLKGAQFVLDAGCGNGFSTIQINKQQNYFVVGIDLYKNSVKAAKRSAEIYPLMKFLQASISQLPFKSYGFDVVYVKRSLSNLPSIELQVETLKELYRVLRPGGLLLLQDLFENGFLNINYLRRRWKLNEIALPYHIIPLKHVNIQSFFSKRPGKLRCIDYTSSYYFLTRIFFEYFSKLLNINLSSTSIWHKLAAILPSWGNLNVNCLYIFEKESQ